LFEEDTPLELIKAVVPDVLVKGGDWSIETIVGRDVVEAAGGTVQTIAFVPNRSTTNIVQKIADLYKH
jgi:bifunctional ADP-heptose synthase (sugar kinase/adenylyltransferase)